MLKTIGNYRVLGCIGRDLSGTVYRAVAADGLCVILSTLHPRMANNEATLMRFYQAARLSMRLSHPNLVKGLEIGQDRGIHFFVREYIHAETLDNRVNRYGALAESQAVALIHAVADGVEELHEVGVVHRGLAPHNILITTGGRIKVAGLNSAKLLEHVLEWPRCPRVSKHALQYWSPQQILDEFDDDIRSDTYALGAILYKLLTGNTPFLGQSIKETLVSKYRHEYIALEKLLPHLSRGVMQTVRQCLSATPERRPQDIAEFRRLLDCETKRPSKRRVPMPIGHQSTDRVCRGRFANDWNVTGKQFECNAPI